MTAGRRGLKCERIIHYPGPAGWAATNSEVKIQVPDPKASANAPEPIIKERRLSEVMLPGLYRALLLLCLRGSDPLGMGDRIEREVRNRWKRP